MTELDLILAIVITALVVGVPFYEGLRVAVKKAISKHKTTEGKLIAAIEAITKYIEKNKTDDEKLIAMAEDIEELIKEIM